MKQTICLLLIGVNLLSGVVSSLAADAAAASTSAAAAGTTAATNAPPKHPWDTSATLGLTLTRGNSQTLTFAGNILAKKKWDQDELDLGADAIYGENNGSVDANAVHGFGQYNHALAERFFAYGRAEALHDEIAKIDYRLTLSPGAGYYFIKGTNSSLRGELGPGWVFERLNGKWDNYPTVRVAERYDQKIGDRSKLWQMVEFLPNLNDTQSWVVNGSIGLDTTITKHLSQTTVLQDSYRSEPAAGRQKNDMKLLAGITYRF